MTALIHYDRARQALAAARRVDEVKQIRDKAEAVRVYAKQAGDYELQNRAAEIRLLAERRAGQLLVEMENTGERQAKEKGRPKKVSSPMTLPKLGITRDQSSKWQRFAKTIDESTFERALAHAKQRDGELTTAGLLRSVREIVRPKGGVTEPDINVIAVELTRDIESLSRKAKLEEIVRLRTRLNPTIRRSLILALTNSLKHAAEAEAQLSRDFVDFPANGKAFQRVIRERMAEEPDPLLCEKKTLAADFANATVREISFAEARNLIVSSEWLGNCGTTEWSYGLYFGTHLGGAVCFGRTAGTSVSNICGEEHAHKVISLVRGCCLPWTDPPRKSSDGRVHGGSAASFLISEACRQMTKRGCHVFVSYSDVDAGEIGTVYQASNWLYCSMTGASQKFKTPDGKIRDARQVHNLTRDRTGGTLKYKRSRAQQKTLLLKQGCEFFAGTPKHRYVLFAGDRRMKRMLRAALRWPVLPYPKRQPQRAMAAAASAGSAIADASRSMSEQSAQNASAVIEHQPAISV